MTQIKFEVTGPHGAALVSLESWKEAEDKPNRYSYVVVDVPRRRRRVLVDPYGRDTTQLSAE